MLSNTFGNHQVADADKVNTNSSEEVTEFDRNDARIVRIGQDYEVDVAHGNTVLVEGFPNRITAVEGYMEPAGSENTALGGSLIKQDPVTRRLTFGH